MKFHPNGEKDASHYGNFEEVRDALCQSLAKKKLHHPEDVIDSVRNMELLDLSAEEPQQLFSTKQNGQDRADQNAAYAKKYEIEYKEWKYCKQDFAANIVNLNATVIEYCSQKMQDKLSKEPDYYTTLYTNPIKLLKTIRKFMTTSDEADWEMFSILEAWQKFVNTHQEKNKSVADYHCRVESNGKALSQLMGDKFLYQFTRNSVGYAAQTTPEAKRDYLETSWERFQAATLLHNMYRKRHQPLIDDMNKKFALKHLPYEQRCEYPATVDNAALVVDRHDKAIARSLGENQRRKTGDSNPSTSESGAGGTQPTGTALAQAGRNQQRGARKCFVCGDTAHIAPQCPNRMLAQDQWFDPSKYRNYAALQLGDTAATAGMSNVQVGAPATPQMEQDKNPRFWAMAQVSSDYVNTLLAQQIEALQVGDDDNSSLTSNVQVGRKVSRVNYQEQAKKRARVIQENGLSYKDLDILDSGSNFDMVCLDHVMDPGSLNMLNQAFEYHTSTGARALSETATVLGGDRYVDCMGMTNIRSLSNAVKKGYRVKFDSVVDNAFHIYPPNGGPVMVYHHHPHGLYVCSLVDLGPQQDSLDPEERPPVVIGHHGADAANGPNHSNNNNTLSGYSGLQTVAGNIEGFTDKQVKRANQARAAYHMAGAPDIE